MFSVCIFPGQKKCDHVAHPIATYTQNRLYSRVVFQFISWLQRVTKLTQSLNQPKSRNKEGEKEKQHTVFQKQLNIEKRD